MNTYAASPLRFLCSGLEICGDEGKGSSTHAYPIWSTTANLNWFDRIRVQSAQQCPFAKMAVARSDDDLQDAMEHSLFGGCMVLMAAVVRLPSFFFNAELTSHLCEVTSKAYLVVIDFIGPLLQQSIERKMMWLSVVHTAQSVWARMRDMWRPGGPSSAS